MARGYYHGDREVPVALQPPATYEILAFVLSRAAVPPWPRHGELPPTMSLHRWAVLVALPIILAAPAEAGPPDREAAGRPGLRLTWGRFLPGGSALRGPSWMTGAAEQTAASGRRYLVAMTRGPLDAEQRALIGAAGAQVIGYIPLDGYRVRLDPRAEGKVRALPFVRWLGELPPLTKLPPRLVEKAGAAGSEAARIRVLLHPGEPHGRAASALSGLEVLATPSGREGAWRMEAVIPSPRLGAVLSSLSHLPEVEAVEEVRRLATLNQDGVWVHQSFAGPPAEETPVFDAGIFGCGQIIGVSDSGQDFDACQFRDAAAGDPPFFPCVSPPCPAGAVDPNQRKDIIYYNWSGTALGDDDVCGGIFGASGHGTHTSGSAAGDASPHADCITFTSPGRDAGDGQAPGARLVFQEMGDGLEYLTVLGGSLVNLLDVAHAGGARIHSFSFGGVCHDALGNCDPSCTLPYDSLARDVDQAMWDHPDLLVVASVANARGLCPPPHAVSTPAIAKSLVGAGSVGHGTAADTPSFFSSDGPVFDGRLKPTLAAQGEQVVSAASDGSPITDNCGTCALDGTSMSAPTTAGLAALVREYYTAGFHAAGTRDPGQGFAPSGALIKATLIHGAAALGAGAPEPDFLSGYGRILLKDSLAFPGSPFTLHVDDHAGGVVTGGTVNHAFQVTAGTPLRATLVWTDYPADLAAAVARVNELMLEAIDPNGGTWLQTRDPNTGLPSWTGDPNASHDDVNVEERFVLSAPGAGLWNFRVRGASVPMGPQPFALVVTGDALPCVPPPAPASVTAVQAGDNRIDVSWSAVSGAATYNVTRSVGSCPGGPGIVVAEAVTGTTFSDTTVSGGTTYSYRVTAASDAAGFCESPSSPCDDDTAIGECLLPPAFGGLDSAGDAAGSTCTVDLSWTAAASSCPGDVVYNVYRGEDASFTPGPSQLVAACVSGTSFSDAAGLSEGIAYHYVVRSEDATTGHGGPCRGGNEDGNLEVRWAVPTGPPSPGSVTDDGGDTGPVVFSSAGAWVIDATGGDTGPLVHSAASGSGECSDLTSPVLNPAASPASPQLTFTTIHDLEYDPFGIFGAEGSLGQVEIATGPGFGTWARLPLSPGYPLPVDFPLNNCTTTAAATSYFTGTDLTYDAYTADLSPWAGQEIRIRFHLSGDLIYTGGYWSVDDIEISPVNLPGSCATGGAGPPPVPDGASVPGQPLDIALAGSDVHLTWDALTCSGAEVNVYWGPLGDYSAFTGGACGLPATGSATVTPPDDVWILVVNTDGSGTDGSWSRDGSGAELTYAGSSAVCPAITQHAPAGTCP